MILLVSLGVLLALNLGILGSLGNNLGGEGKSETPIIILAVPIAMPYSIINIGKDINAIMIYEPISIASCLACSLGGSGVGVGLGSGVDSGFGIFKSCWIRITFGRTTG